MSCSDLLKVAEPELLLGSSVPSLPPTPSGIFQHFYVGEKLDLTLLAEYKGVCCVSGPSVIRSSVSFVKRPPRLPHPTGEVVGGSLCCPVEQSLGLAYL